MNLKMKLKYKATAVVKIISDTSCIYSDEISPTHKNALSIIEATDKIALWTKIQERALKDCSSARFAPTILIINQDEELSYAKVAQPKDKDIPEYNPAS